MTKFEKYEKDGQVAVIYSPGFGSGWYSWNSNHEGLLFDKELVELILERKFGEAGELAKQKYSPDMYIGSNVHDLCIEWVDKGTRFEIHEYDGSESVRILAPDDGHVA